MVLLCSDYDFEPNLLQPPLLFKKVVDFEETVIEQLVELGFLVFYY